MLVIILKFPSKVQYFEAFWELCVMADEDRFFGVALRIPC